jgi:hypothetical protein
MLHAAWTVRARIDWQSYYYDFFSLQKLLKVFIFWITFNLVTYGWVQHTLLLRQARDCCPCPARSCVARSCER